MLLHIIQVCLTALLGGVIIGITIAILAILIYILAGFISSLVEAFEEVRTKKRALKAIKNINLLASAIKSENEKK